MAVSVLVTEELMSLPGASRSTRALMFDVAATASAPPLVMSVRPTATADEMHAGAETALT
jgi:hypothetical protein